jgi:RNA polymerase sigma factor (sigma-70 family)
MFALIRAAELYDPQHWSRAKFITYATKAIRNRIIQHAKSEGMIRLPWYIVDEMNDPANDTPKHRQARAAYVCRMTTEVPEEPSGSGGEEFDSETLYRVLSRLDARDRELVMDYWGLGGREQRNTRALAQVYGVSYQQISNRLRALKKRLRRHVEFELELEAAPRRLDRE